MVKTGIIEARTRQKNTITVILVIKKVLIS